MIINQSALSGIYRSFKVIFNNAFGAAKSNFEKIATVIPSGTRDENYKWLGKVPRMREWIGERVIQNLSGYDYTVKNKDWESTVAVDRNDIEDDSIGVYNPLVQSIGDAAATHPDELVFGLLPKGFTNLCYDGQYFFDTDHQDGDGPIQSNKGTKKLTVASYGEYRANMMSQLDEKGNPLGIFPGLLVVAPANEGMGRKILFADIVGGDTNIYKGTADILVDPRLATMPDAWYLLDVSRPIKPIIFQQRKLPEFIALDNPTDQNVFMRKQFVYGVDSRDNAGYGLWQLAYGSNGTIAG